MTIVTIDNDVYGATHAVAREITATEILAEMSYLPPAGTVMTIWIGGIQWAMAEVVGHRYEDDERRTVRLRFFGGTANVPVSCTVH